MLQVIDLKKNYNTVEALRGVTLDISDGEFISIMGKSGCGKTTLLHCMSGILKPSSGEILFDEKSLFKIKDRARSKVRRTSMGFVFQFFNLVPELTVKENILLPLKINRYKVDEVYFDKLIEDLGIIEQINRLPATLSGGQQQRVAIARALIHKPKIVFADEPSGNLDETSSREVIELLQSLQKEYNLTLIMVTHDKDIASYADRIIHMRDGRIVSQ
ncbi:MAG: ABC transporter ATP-binding protein [Erysipelotrichia bacterium]|jgi:putative ABC transport system ATP-binding protein|nr:ABC transporter ATP-binding protein [Erysipelotrichia bacterium]